MVTANQPTKNAAIKLINKISIIGRRFLKLTPLNFKESMGNVLTIR